MRNKFKMIYEHPIDMGFLSQEKAKEIAIKKWEEKIGSKEASFYPDKKDKIKLFELRPSCKVHSIECLEMARKNILFFPNVTGLVILEKLDIIYNFIPNGAFILGIDDLHYLQFDGHSHLIPVLRKTEGKYSYMHYFWNMHFEHDDYVVFFKKN